MHDKLPMSGSTYDTQGKSRQTIALSYYREWTSLKIAAHYFRFSIGGGGAHRDLPQAVG